MDDFVNIDDIFDGVDLDQLVQTADIRGMKRSAADGYVDDTDTVSQEGAHKSVPESKRLKTSHGAMVGDNTIADQENIALARSILKQTFGYPAFRHEQEGAIKRILAGKNALVIFPTGAGKSLCYQIPGIAFPELDMARGSRKSGHSGITIVISPLIALMKDQVDVLKKRGVQADCIDSTKTMEQLKAIDDKLSRGEMRILYCSPERLNNERFVLSMKHVPGGIRLIAVDEAHCISEWGNSFRPEYLKVARFVEETRAERVICLTATATARVANDVCKAFGIDEHGVFRTSPYRPNLILHAESLDDPSKKLAKLVKFLTSHPGPTLVYVTRQQEAEDLAEVLVNKKFKAASFHAGMKVEDKTNVQENFMANRVQVVVATIAFGMGVDKPDIRNCIHYTLPATIEEYSQQVGRAGRDGRTSNCMLYLCNADFWTRENFARGDLPSYEPFRRLIGDIFDDEVTSLSVGGEFKKNLNEQMKEFDIRQNPLTVIYAILELHHRLIRAITPEYNLYQYEIIKPGEYPGAIQTMVQRGRPEAAAILKYAKKKTKFTDLDINQIVRETNFFRADIIQILEHLDREDIIRLTAKGVTPKFRVLHKLPKTEMELDVLAKDMYKHLEQKEKDALQKTREVVELITAADCFAHALTQHFGMALPDGKIRCGHCTFCETGKPVVLPPKEERPIDRALVAQVLGFCPVRDDPRFLARIVFGIMSPRVRDLKMHESFVWGCMADQDFDKLIEEFSAACKTAKFEQAAGKYLYGLDARTAGGSTSRKISGARTSRGRGTSTGRSRASSTLGGRAFSTSAGRSSSRGHCGSYGSRRGNSTSKQRGVSSNFRGRGRRAG